MIPVELLTMGASAIFSGVMTLWKQSIDNKAMIFEQTLAKSKAQAEIYEAVRNNPNKGFHFTRRIIALTAIGAIIVWPMIVPVFWPDVPVTVGWTQMKGGFWFFKDAQESFVFHTVTNGIVLTPLTTHLVSAITGFFFGNQIVK